MSTAAEQTPKANEMFEQAAKLFETAIQAGIKMQEEAVHSLGDMMRGLGSPQQWQKQTQAALEQAFTAAQQNVDETIRMMNENAKTSLDLLQKAFDACQDGSPAETRAHAREMWETAIGSLRRNTEVMLQANNRVLESWREMAKLMRRQTETA
jgi:type I site-specific restriction endonuclease